MVAMMNQYRKSYSIYTAHSIQSPDLGLDAMMECLSWISMVGMTYKAHAFLVHASKSVKPAIYHHYSDYPAI